MNLKIIRISPTLWAIPLKTFKPRRNIPEVICLHKIKQNRQEEEKMVENEEVSNISVEKSSGKERRSKE
jgi:hypothetical protein